MRGLALRLVLLSGLLLGPAVHGYAEGLFDRSEATKRDQRQRLEPTYKIQAGLNGEIYPVFANYASLQNQEERTLGVVFVTVSNPGETLLHQRMGVQILGWSEQEIQIVKVVSGTTQTFIFAPKFLPRFYQNHEIVATTARVSVSDLSGHSVYETNLPVRLRSSEDMYWGKGFKYAPLIASWVTPHDARVKALLAQARAYTPDHRMPGYEGSKNSAQQEQETYREARAIFMALQHQGMSYVTSSDTPGDHKDRSERIRMPGISLRESSANSMDAAVMYASFFENLGMDAIVIIVPGHAYAGVRVASNSTKFLLIDVALAGGNSFEDAVTSAETGLAKYDVRAITRIAIPQARTFGIYPMP